MAFGGASMGSPRDTWDPSSLSERHRHGGASKQELFPGSCRPFAGMTRIRFGGLAALAKPSSQRDAHPWQPLLKAYHDRTADKSAGFRRCYTAGTKSPFLSGA